MKATRIKMKSGCHYSNSLLEISEIYIESCDNPGYYAKNIVHDYLLENPDSICVNRYPYPYLEPATSKNNEKYVRSKGNDSIQDNLLMLPRD